MIADLRYALRSLLSRKTFALTAGLTLALGFGATTAMFTVVDGVLLRPLPFPDSERVLVLCETNPRRRDGCGASPANVEDWRRASRTLDSAGVIRNEAFIAQDARGPFGVRGGIASPGFFRVMRAQPALGRVIDERDMPAGANRVAVVSDRFWRQHLGADPAVVGRAITLDGARFAIIGVLPADTYVPVDDAIDVWKPLSASIDDVTNRNWRGFLALGRLAAGAEPRDAEAELRRIRDDLARAHPTTNSEWDVRTERLRTYLTGPIERTLWLVLGAVALLLVTACANVAGLVLVQGTRRTGEFVVRTALGASRASLVRLALAEYAILALLAGIAGLLIAAWLTRVFLDFAPSGIPRLDEIGIDTRIALFTFGLALATTLAFGIAPAWTAPRTDLAATMHSARGATAAGTSRRAWFVTAELALSVLLLIGSGLLVRAFLSASRWDPGFDRRNVLVAWLLAPTSRYTSAGAAVEMLQRARDEVATIPGVQSVGLASGGPLFGGIETGSVTVGAASPNPDAPPVHWFDIDEHFIATLGVRLRDGRGFTAADRAGAPPVAVVNETFARRYFPDGRALGQRVTVMDHASEIVGVLADITPVRKDQPTPAEIYWPIQQYRRFAAYLVIRAAPGTAGLETAVRARVAAVEPSAQTSSLQPLDRMFDRTLVSPRFNAVLIAAFALVALGLAAIGVAGLVSFMVASRTREIGLRIALGASPRQLVRGFVGHGLALAAGGMLLGGIAAWWLGASLQSLLHGVRSRDPLTFVVTLGVFGLVAAMASYLPARRASRVDPLSALRSD